jgi:predicted DNA-binding protein
VKRQVAFTLRFDPDLYQRIKTASQLKGRSMAAFVQEAITRKLTEEDAVALFDAFTLVGQDVNEVSVDYASEAQRVIALDDE